MRFTIYGFFLVVCLSCNTYAQQAQNHRPQIVYGRYTDTWNLVSYDTLNEPQRTYYTNLISEEMAKYPEEFYERIGMKYIVLAKDLKFSIDYRASIPDKAQNILFMGIRDDYTDNYVRHCFHHEQSHFTEYALWNDYRYNWDQWAELYKGGREGGETAYRNNDRTVGVFRNDLPGFVNRYATLGQEEDRAEILAFFMTDSEHNMFMNQAQADSVIHKKTVLLFTLYADKLYFPGMLERYEREYVHKKE